MRFTISNGELQKLSGGEAADFPKYTSQLINWANQNAQGTRPKTVGQMSDLFPEFTKAAAEIVLDAWKKWYLERYPNALDEASDKIYGQIQNLQNAITLINKNMVRKWVEDLVITKTFGGMYVQKAVLAKIAELKKQEYRLAAKEEESKGIDGFIGGKPFSVKPDTYKTMNRLPEEIGAAAAYYKKTKTGLKVEVYENF